MDCKAVRVPAVLKLDDYCRAVALVDTARTSKFRFGVLNRVKDGLPLLLSDDLLTLVACIGALASAAAVASAAINAASAAAVGRSATVAAGLADPARGVGSAVAVGAWARLESAGVACGGGVVVGVAVAVHLDGVGDVEDGVDGDEPADGGVVFAGAEVGLMGLAFSGQLFSGLIYAASCRFRYSLWTSCGVL
jgi:hypothetical protein